MKRGTLEMIIRAFNAASDDVTRFNLCNVKVTRVEGRFEISATNGPILSCSKMVDDDEDVKVWEGTQYFHREQLSALKLILKECIYTVPVQANPDRTVQLGMMITVKSDRSVEWPKVEGLRPVYPENAFTVIFNPEFLLALSKALTIDKNVSRAVVLTFKDAKSPILVTVGDNEGLLMPARL